MKKIILLIVVLLAAFSFYWFKLRSKSSGPQEPKPAPMLVKKHSDSFNKTINNVVANYLELKDAFVEADTAAVKSKVSAFLTSLNQVDTIELKKDTSLVFETVMATIGDIKSNAESLQKQTDITEMRRDFSSLTDVMYPTFFIAIKYEGPKLYLDNCPMAFSDSIPANWISSSAEIINPYLGKKHPKYHAGMLGCGEIKDSIEAK
ncbi:MAG: DUF3347 domain-containing protein [Bacteroidetes bacterium]|nr:DUF3347 domain-containing protein [Bacteroidota bacterium]MBS1757512.1 DUF3347 domain-containing protein [Bacteroidota bacterium]